MVTKRQTIPLVMAAAVWSACALHPAPISVFPAAARSCAETWLTQYGFNLRDGVTPGSLLGKDAGGSEVVVLTYGRDSTHHSVSVRAHGFRNGDDDRGATLMSAPAGTRAWKAAQAVTANCREVEE